jgi:hypothetical protein
MIVAFHAWRKCRVARDEKIGASSFGAFWKSVVGFVSQFLNDVGRPDQLDHSPHVDQVLIDPLLCSGNCRAGLLLRIRRGIIAANVRAVRAILASHREKN